MIRKLAVAVCLLLASVVGFGSPADAAFKGIGRVIGSCSYYVQAGTLGSGWPTKIRAMNSGCLHIRARRSAATSWLKVSNPGRYTDIFLAQGNNSWVEFEAKSEIHVMVGTRRVDTHRWRCTFSPGDWYSAAKISCVQSVLDT